MFVADSSVFIDFLDDRPGREVERLARAVETAEKVCLCGPILQEVLQGIRAEAEYQTAWRRLLDFTVFETTRWTFLRAASLYRFLRRKGATVNSFDTTIAAVCLENYVPLLTRDQRDFAPMAKYAGLKLV
ncbi:MAG TPA: PIN domain nuclease [Planctomycetota bacterium]